MDTGTAVAAAGAALTAAIGAGIIVARDRRSRRQEQPARPDRASVPKPRR